MPNIHQFNTYFVVFIRQTNTEMVVTADAALGTLRETGLYGFPYVFRYFFD